VVGAGTVLFWTVVEVVVVGAGFSTTVVHEFKSMVTARSGMRMISFFIVGVVASQTIRHRCLNQMYFGRSFSNFIFR
jgi:hypothetical protein